MTNKKITSILGVIKNPNNTIKEISENENYYFVPSIAILVISSIFFINISSPSEEISSLPTNEIGYILDAEIQIIDGIVKVLGGFLNTVIIFYLGKKLGGSKNFRRVFSVVSYSLIPVLIGGILVSIFLYYPPLLEYISGIDSTDSEFGTLFWILYYGLFLPCGIWSLILLIKALKIANNFGTKKAFGTFVLAAIIDYFIWFSIFELNIIDHPYFG